MTFACEDNIGKETQSFQSSNTPWCWKPASHWSPSWSNCDQLRGVVTLYRSYSQGLVPRGRHLKEKIKLWSKFDIIWCYSVLTWPSWCTKVASGVWLPGHLWTTNIKMLTRNYFVFVCFKITMRYLWRRRCRWKFISQRGCSGLMVLARERLETRMTQRPTP